ncbi:MAG: HEAT repeat domain-containing protein [Acidobacteria bacterium]|nr:HEAT repeat domain-containing protein [Acidobacteriota bacterium]
MKAPVPTADAGSNGSSTAPPALTPQRRRTPLAFIILAVLFVVVPFLTWYLTWFGRPLSDEDISKYLADEKNVRHVQQALTQIEERIERGDSGARKWYPQIVALAGSPVTEIRKTAAWVMGQDNKSEEFHAALRRLLEDTQPVVRRNAAVQSSVAVREGAKVSAGDVVLTIAPDPDFVYEALRALLFVGEAEDLPFVEQYERGVEGMPERVKQQAAQTAKAIRGRSEKKGPTETK